MKWREKNRKGCVTFLSSLPACPLRFFSSPLHSMFWFLVIYPGAFISGSNVKIRRFGVDLITFEVSEFHFCGILSTSKVTTSAPNSRKIKFDAPFDAAGSGFSSALRINIVGETHERVKHFLWKSKLRTTPNCDGAHGTCEVLSCRVLSLRALAAWAEFYLDSVWKLLIWNQNWSSTLFLWFTFPLGAVNCPCWTRAGL